MTRSREHPWLNRFAWLTAVCTFLLIGLGGLVTSKGAGMAVPDWPTTYGYNMFLFPIHLWTGGIFYEHTHRLFASFVGLLTVVLAVWLWLREARPWLRWAGLLAVIAVILQGVLGGLRVTLFKDEIGIVHATLAQAFFVFVTTLALFVSGRGDKIIASLQERGAALRGFVITATILVLAQLVLGASMRHQHAGLAIPDFPLAYGQLWPPMNSEFIERANQARTGVQEYKPITAFQIGLHMAHRVGAFLIIATVLGAAWKARVSTPRGAMARFLTGTWLMVILVQAALGAATVWSNKAADVATAHVLLGALSLLLGAVFSTGLLVHRPAISQVEAARLLGGVAWPKPSLT